MMTTSQRLHDDGGDRRKALPLRFQYKHMLRDGAGGEEAQPGAILSNTYFYGKSIGKYGGERFYYVEDINTDTPKFHDDYKFKVSSNLFAGQILDVSAALRNRRRDRGRRPGGDAVPRRDGGQLRGLRRAHRPDGRARGLRGRAVGCCISRLERAVPASSRASPAGRTTAILGSRVRRHQRVRGEFCVRVGGRLLVVLRRRARRGACGGQARFYPADNGCYRQDDCTCLEACADCELVARARHAALDNCASGDAQYLPKARVRRGGERRPRMFDAQTTSGTVLTTTFMLARRTTPRTTTAASSVGACADVQGALFFVESRASAPAVCGDLVRRLFECSYEHQAAEVLGLNCSLNCSSTLAPTPAPVAAPATPARERSGGAPRRPLP